MGMGVDESWRHNVPSGINCFLSADGSFGNRRNPATLDPDVSHPITVRFRIHEATAQNDDVVFLRMGKY
jgi:hypothetical protein